MTVVIKLVVGYRYFRPADVKTFFFSPWHPLRPLDNIRVMVIVWRFGHLACINRPRNDLLCVEWDVKPYTLTLTHRGTQWCIEHVTGLCWLYKSQDSRNTCNTIVLYSKQGRSHISKIGNVYPSFLPLFLLSSPSPY